MIDVIKAIAVNNLCYKAAQKMTPKGIVVHSTGANNPNLKRYVNAPKEVGVNKYGNHWDNAKPDGINKCVHAFIGYDNKGEIRIAEILPLNICCWGVGKGKKGSYNKSPAYIQFEICEDDLNNEVYYRKAFNLAIEYCAELCKRYDIDTSNIVGHYEAYKQGYGSNHGDPEHWMKKYGETMEDFREAVSKALRTDSDKLEREDETIEFRKDDLVEISSYAKYYNGKAVPNWVKKQRWYVKEDQIGDRVIIDKNEKGTNSICSPIHKKYLKAIDAETYEITLED